MKKLFISTGLLLALSINFCNSQEVKTTKIPFLANEKWWGGVVAYGSKMPYVNSIKSYDLASQNDNNQVVPLFISNKGRFIWDDKPFRFSVDKDELTINSKFSTAEVQNAGSTLRDAYLSVSKKYFPANGQIPEPLFFSMPQYNTWIELMYNQNQQDILNYAKAVVANGFPTGVLMIDDNWQRYYGNFDFRAEKFPDPKAMIKELHELGFKVMLWVCPFVSADSQEYRELLAKGYLIKAKDKNEAAMITWWNGKSACYDLTNPAAEEYFINKLKYMQSEYSVDGFKFDAGDTQFYSEDLIDSYKKDAISTDHTEAWAKIGLSFPFNEYRAGWKMGGQPLVQRLGDKDYSWNAIQMLIPDMIAAGLLGYAYTCPDMIGGGQFTAFLTIKANEFDQKLIVRSAQIHALMPMMQFSVAPWRILDEENLEITKSAAKLHQQFGSYILEQAHKSSESGEPIVRHLDYSFPNQGFELCKDQFMLGDKFMVAPVVTNIDEREVKLPKGKWRDDFGKTHKGGRTIKISVPLSRLPYFEKL